MYSLHVVNRSRAKRAARLPEPGARAGDARLLPACAATAAVVGVPGSGGISNLITKHEIGVAWDNEISWWLDKNVVIKGQFSFLFPGDGIRQVTRALANNGSQPDETAIRLAMELLWNF